MNLQAKQKLVSAILIFFFIVLAIFAIFPLLLITLSSFKPSTELMRHGLNLSFSLDNMSFKNYVYIFTDGQVYLRWYLNSMIITGLVIVLSLFFSSLVGYAMAIYNFAGRYVLFVLVLFSLMIPFEILMLPLYRLMVSLQLINTYFGIMLPMIVSPVAVFFFRQFALGLPKELLDSARIDGCTEYGIFFRIMAPLMLPAYAAMAILTGLFSWNNFLWPLIVIRSNDLFTLPVGLATLLTPYGNNYDLLISGSVLSIIPIIILFFIFQRYFVSGLAAGSIKG